jgi:tetratricopeptide (TPR) repeat protein
LAVAAGLFVVTFAAFAPSLGCGFINFDDPFYVTKNAHVDGGLTPEGVRWAFTATRPFYWHPLTWLSLELDASLWPKADGKPNPFGFHLTNVLLHAANAVLLFFALHSLTGAFWRSAAAALLFAVHPLRVESVAWVTERKDVLSAFFGLLALWAYAAYARRPSLVRYLGVAVAFALSLMAKPMLVTLPFLLLVLDWWPLGRWSRARAVTVAAEKIPLLALVAGSVALTFQTNVVMPGLEHVSPAGRAGNAVIGYAFYLAKTVWPAGLAVFYPHPLDASVRNAHLPAGQLVASAVLLAAVTCATLAMWRRAPYLPAGWAWFVGTLVPVSGLAVQAGSQAYADRFTYFPQIGLLVAGCWGLADLAGKRSREALVAAAAAAVLLAVLTQTRLAVWRDPVDLWRNALAVTGDNHVALMNLGQLLEERGKDGEAARCYRKTLELDPDCFDAHVNLAMVFLRAGQVDEATKENETALRLDPNADGVYCNQGMVEVTRRRYDRAITCFREALRLNPDSVQAHANLGGVFAEQGNLEEAALEHEEAVRLSPDYASEHYNLASVRFRQGKLDDAVRSYEQAVRCEPGLYAAHFDLGTAELKRGNLARAAAAYREALRLQPDSFEARGRLGLVLLRDGQADEGLTCLRELARRNPQSGQAHEYLGQALEAAKDLRSAAGEFAAAVRLAPASASAWYNLGRACSWQGEKSRAVACFEQALAREPGSDLYRKALGAAKEMPERPAGGEAPAGPRP